MNEILHKTKTVFFVHNCEEKKKCYECHMPLHELPWHHSNLIVAVVKKILPVKLKTDKASIQHKLEEKAGFSGRHKHTF